MFDNVNTFIEQIQHVRTIPDLEKLVLSAVGHYDIQHFVCTSIDGFEPLPGVKPMFGTWDSDWMTHYLSSSYHLEDIVAHHPLGIEANFKPYYWTEVVAIKELSKKQASIVAECWDAEYREGLVIPLTVSFGEIAMISMGGRNFKQDTMVAGILWSISVQAHRRAREIILRDFNLGQPVRRVAYDTQPDIASITKEEKKVLAMLANDLKPGAIAVATNRSVGTVRKQLASAKEKLGVDNPEAAVYIARNHWLI